jgi:hypothetical protein
MMEENQKIKGKENVAKVVPFIHFSALSETGFPLSSQGVKVP